MAIGNKLEIIQNPNLILFAGNNVKFKIKSATNYETVIPASVLFKLTDAGNLDSFAFEYGNKKITFYVRATGSISGFNYVLTENLIDCLKANYELNADFEIVASKDKISLTAKKDSSDFDVDITSKSITIEKTVVAYSLQTNYLNYRINLKLFVNNELVAHEAILPNSENIATFELSDYLNKQIKNIMPGAIKIVEYDDVCVPFSFSYFDTFGATNERINIYQSGTFNAIRGGISKEVGYVDVLGFVSSKFLTNQNRTKKISLQQPEYLYFFSLKDATFSCLIKKQLFNHLIESNLHTFQAKKNCVYQIPTGSDIVTDKNLISYNVYVKNSRDEVVSEVFNYVIDNNYQHNTFLIFKNSIGGYDTMRTTSKLIVKNKIKREVIQYEDVLMNIKNKNILNFEINSGHIFYANTQHISEMLMSNDIYILYKGLYINVICENKENVDFQNDKFISNINLKFKSVVTSEYYSNLNSL